MRDIIKIYYKILHYLCKFTTYMVFIVCISSVLHFSIGFIPYVEDIVIMDLFYLHEVVYILISLYLIDKFLVIGSSYEDKIKEDSDKEEINKEVNQTVDFIFMLGIENNLVYFEDADDFIKSCGDLIRVYCQFYSQSENEFAFEDLNKIVNEEIKGSVRRIINSDFAKSAWDEKDKSDFVFQLILGNRLKKKIKRYYKGVRYSEESE